MRLYYLFADPIRLFLDLLAETTGHDLWMERNNNGFLDFCLRKHNEGLDYEIWALGIYAVVSKIR